MDSYDNDWLFLDDRQIKPDENPFFLDDDLFWITEGECYALGTV